MRKTELTDQTLGAAINEMENGLIDANLGGNVYKKRVALPGMGKRGGVRTIIATNLGNRWFFVFGFEKNERENIGEKQLTALKAYSKTLLESSEAVLDTFVASGALEEVVYEGQ